MAKAYSDDLRRKVLEAHVRGEGTLEDLAERFSVSFAWTAKISASFTRTGKMERPPGRKPGRTSKITPEIEKFLKKAVSDQPDATLGELQLRLLQEQELGASIGLIWSVVERLGLRLKKKLYTPPSRTVKPYSSDGSSSVKRSARLRSLT